MKLFYLAPLLLFSLSILGQKSLEEADKYYADFYFEKAISLYLEAFKEENVDSFYIQTRLAESYRKSNNIKEAAHWYQQTLFQSRTKSIYYLHCGIMLQNLGECDSANVYLDIYEKLNPTELHSPRRRCKDKSARIPKIEKCYYKVNPLPFNTKDNEVKVTFYKDNLLLTRTETESPRTNIRDGYGWYAGSLNKIFLADIETVNVANYQYTYDSMPKEFQFQVNTKFRDVANFYHEDSSWHFITRNNFFSPSRKKEKSIHRYKIFHSKIDQDNQLKDAIGLPFNSDEYSVMHPFLAADGVTLYFASDMPGGFGGFDIYKSIWEEYNGDFQWSPPMNLGPDVNTAHDEKSPYLLENKNRLYFSSNRSESFGGYDIFYFNYEEDAYYNFTQLPKPLNSDSNEIDFIINDEGVFGYIASDRVGGRGGFDIYSFTDISVQTEVLVFDRNTNLPLPDAEVYNSLTRRTLTTNKSGKIYTFLPPDIIARFSASKNSFITNQIEISTEGYEPDEKMFTKIPLLRTMTFNLSGQVRSAATGEPISNAIVYLMNDCDEPERVDTTGVNGFYSFNDLKMDCCFRVKASREPLYLAGSVDKICTRGRTEDINFQETIELSPIIQRRYIHPSQRIDIVYHGKISSENGEPFANKTLVLKSTCEDKSLNISTNENGKYAFRLKKRTCCYELLALHDESIYFEINHQPILFCPIADDKGEATQIHRDLKVYQK